MIVSFRQRFEEFLRPLNYAVFRGLDERLLFYLKRHVKVSGHLRMLSPQQITEELSSTWEIIPRLLKKLEQTAAVKHHRNSKEVFNLER